MRKKIRVGAVSYLNTRPLIYGFQQGMMHESIELTLDYPAQLTQKMQSEALDIALLPVASIPLISGATVFSDYCIASDKTVASVCIFSEVPIEEIQEIYLDYQSRTSVALFKLLMKEYWKIRPAMIEADENFISSIKGKRAGIIIGDRALQLYDRFPFRYDLAEAWYHHTQLPFVFATWVSRKNYPSPFIREFNEANEMGLSKINEIIRDTSCETYNLETYYTENIAYRLNDKRRSGLQLFLNLLDRI
jgi:chorismate dehydratase